MPSSPTTQALLAAMMHSDQPMVLSDPNAPDHPMIAVNAAFEVLTGYPAAHAVGRNCRFLQGEDTDTAATARLRACIAQQRGCVEWLVNYRSDGAKFWNLLFISPIFGPDGELLHYFGNQRDITHGAPADRPEYVLGKADMPAAARAELQALLLDILADLQSARGPAPIAAAAARLNEVTLDLAPARWTPPGGG